MPAALARRPPLRRAGSASAASAAISAASRSGVNSAWSMPDRAAGLHRARRRWRAGPGRARAAAAPGSPGRPIAASSATVEAPERDTTRWLAAIRAGRSVKNGATSAVDAEPRIGVAHARAGPRRAPAARSSSRVAQRRLEPLDRGRHDVGHHPRALAAAEHEEPERPAGVERRIGHRRRRDHRRPHRIAGVRRLGGERRRRRRARRESRSRSRATRGASNRLARPITRVLLVDQRRDAAQRSPPAAAARSDSRRSRRRPPAAAAAA